MPDETKLMRIRDLAKRSGVSIQTIHYYLREGLLPPPIKTAANMAYYGPEYIEDIRLIKELQAKQYLPLSVIKLMLEAKRQGKDTSQLQDMRLSLEQLFRPLGPEEELAPLTVTEFVAMTGLAASTIEELEKMGLLTPAVTSEGKRYDGLDVQVARQIKKLIEGGLPLSDLELYRQYIETLQTEARMILQKVFRSPAGPSIRGSEVKETLDNLKTALATKVYRQMALESRRANAKEPKPE
ncbi:MAG: MerR family transcriptional regulator [Chloroflexi bacterium]|nr:MerR family transcriptional regulator [Chloroflexota bacterium]